RRAHRPPGYTPLCRVPRHRQRCRFFPSSRQRLRHGTGDLPRGHRMIQFLLDVFEANRENDALVWCDTPFSYHWLLERVGNWRARLEREGIRPGTIVAVEADFSPNAVALFLALAETNCVFVPLTSSVAAKKSEFLEVAEV